ncbi:MAG: hypothetical protein KF809_06950 [Chloroflexi bacterium]|nr:hypothetical protein [Chloroflexota bacterium]
MTDHDRRRELRAAYRETPRQAAVVRIHVGTTTSLLDTTLDLAALCSRLDFARTTGTTSALDLRLRSAIGQDGLDSVRIEVLDTLDPAPGATADETRRELDALADLWREGLAATGG